MARLALAAVAVLAVAFLARPALTRFIAWIAATRSAELFLLGVLSLVLATAFLAGEIGLSLPLGAFLAGKIIGESDFRHQVEDDIRPFRDVLLGLFFLTVGMQIDLGAVLAAPLLALGALFAFLLAKPLIVYLSAYAMHRQAEPSLRAAIILAHGGEFGLLILTQALSAQLIAPAIGQPLLSALVLSMALAPTLIQFNRQLARLVARVEPWRGGGDFVDGISGASRDLSNHVILCGCGRVGRLVACLFEASNVPYLAIELDYNRLRQARRQGHNVAFGDAGRRHILDAAGLKRAVLVVITFDDRSLLQRMLHDIRHEAPRVPVIVSAADDQDIETLVTGGASTVLPENFAAGLAVGAQALARLGFSHAQVASRVNQLRLSPNPELREASLEAEAAEDAGKCADR